MVAEIIDPEGGDRRDPYTILPSDMTVLGELRVLEERIVTATNLAPAAVLLPYDVLRGVRSLWGYPVVRDVYAKPAFVWEA